MVAIWTLKIIGWPSSSERTTEMAIKVKCSCGVGFSAKDELAGKRVKCPKCSQPLLIPSPGNKRQAMASVSGSPSLAGTVAGNLGDPLADLLDEIGVKGMQVGPACTNCETLITPGARLCINCGFNFETGQMLNTVSYDEDDEFGGMSETEKMLAKAEREIEDMPISGEGEDFGDGAGSYLLAAIIGLVALTITGIALAITMQLQDMAETDGSARMAVLASAGFVLAAHLWMVIAAFLQEPKLGVMCVFIPGFSLIYSILYRYWFATLMMVMGSLVFIACYTVLLYSK